MKKIEIENRKAGYQYELLNKYTAGIQLTGSEIKSVRLGRANLGEAYCFFRKGELYIKNMHITEYKYGTDHNHEPKRTRKLLLKKYELRRLEAKLKEQGLTIVPTRLFTNDRGYAKVEIALAKGKKYFSKKESIKQKDLKRDLDRQLNRR